MKTALFTIFFWIVASSTYAQTCAGSVGDPIVNLTFGAGAANPGPALSPGITNMTYTTTTCPSDGYYTIANYSSNCFGGWITLHDHTGDPNGYYMLVNADVNPRTFFVDTINNLCGGVTYQFAAWIINMVVSSGYIEPNLTFNIKTPSGTLLQSNTTGNIPISGTTWGQHSFNFTTPIGVTAVVLSISNNAPGGSGNDLAIDDITFRPVGPRVDVGIQGYAVDTVSFCGSIPALTLTSQVDPCYVSTDYQWQRSINGGTSWSDIAGATSPTYIPGIGAYGNYLYRLTVAAQGNISSIRCRVVSTVISISYTPGPALTISPKDTTVCSGKTVVITAGGATGTYLWSNSHSGQGNTVTVTATASYIVSVTSASGCISTDTAFVHIYSPAVPTISQIASGHCAGDSVTFYASGGSGYHWSTGALTPSITVLPVSGTVYTVSTTDAHGCSVATAATASPAPAWSISSTVQQSCSGVHTGVISVSVAGTSTYHYLWSNGKVTARVDSLAPAAYTVQVSDGSGCDTTLSFVLSSLPVVNALVSPHDTTVCPGQRVAMAATGGSTYQWSDLHQGPQDIVTVTANAVYIVTATAANGCTARDTARVHIYGVTPASISQIASGHCLRDSITLYSSTTAAGYHWNTTASTSSITVHPQYTSTYTVTTTDANGCTASASSTASVHAPWTVSAVVRPTCSGTDLGMITLTVVNSNLVQYQWSNGETTARIDSLAPATYTVQLSDGTGCDTTLSFVLSSLPVVNALVSPHDTTVCPGKRVAMAATGGSTYQWSDLHQGPQDIVTVTANAVYIVTATAANGCTARDTARVNIYGVTPASISQLSSGHCSGDSITLSASSSVSYHWSTGAVTPSITVHPTSLSTYIVTTTDANGCTSSASVAPPVIPMWNITTSTSPPPCPGVNLGAITLTVTSTGMIQYLWNNGETNAQIDSLAPASYTVQLSDSYGCDTILNFILTNLPAVQGSVTPRDTTVCPGQRVIFTASGGNTYQWSDQNQGAQDMVTVMTTAMYMVSVERGQGCIDIDTAYAHVYPVLAPLITEVSTGPCSKDSVYLSVTGGVTYLWNTGATGISLSIYPVTNASYIVSATDTHGCVSVDSTRTIATADWVITPATFAPPCPGVDIGTIDLTASGDSTGMQYLWATGEISAHLASLASGTYAVTVSDARGCKDSFSFVLAYSYTLDLAISPQDTTVAKGSQVPLTILININNGNSYQWYPSADLSCSNCDAPVASVIDTDYTYVLMVTDQYGCRATDSMHIRTMHQGPIYIPNAFTPNGDDINDYFQIFGEDISPLYIPVFEVKIFDRWGELIYESNDPHFKWDGIYKGTLMPPGVYVYLIDYLQAGVNAGRHAKGSLTLIR